MSLKILVCGSRDWEDAEAIERRLFMVPYLEPFLPVVIHGGARGADEMAGEAAAKLGMLERVFPADWERHGKRAGILRNLLMLDEKPDVVIAFQKGGSRGTQHTIDEARRRGIKVEVHTAGARPTAAESTSTKPEAEGPLTQSRSGVSGG